MTLREIRELADLLLGELRSRYRRAIAFDQAPLDAHAAIAHATRGFCFKVPDAAVIVAAILLEEMEGADARWMPCEPAREEQKQAVVLSFCRDAAEQSGGERT
jgi:hypothetical protein